MTATNDHVAMLGGELLARLDSIEKLLRDVLLDSEQEPDFDQTYIVGGALPAAAVVPIALPRTLRHVEITLSVTASVQVALLGGIVLLADAQKQHGQVNAAGANSNAIVTSGGGAITSRDFLDQSGYLTVFFAAAVTGYANVRVRALGATQARLQRT